MDQNNNDANKSLSVFDIILLFWQRILFIIKVTGGITLLSVVISLLMPNYYKSTATLLPSNTASLGRFSGFSELASLAGVDVGGGDDQEKLYPLIIMSEAILKNVVYSTYHPTPSISVNLIKFWEIEEKTAELEYETALKRLREDLNVSLDLRANTISISIETTEPQVSAEILNNILSELDLFMKTKKVTNASEQRKWVGNRLIEVEQDLKKSEDILKNFRENNRMISMSPDLVLREGRLRRDVEINQALYIELKKQFELARIEEVRTTPIINVLDKARAAAKKERPKRSLIVLFFFSVGFLVSVSYITLSHFYREQFKRIFRIFRNR
jgi:uncharacterized protein involved in exopolysaccharide biosynthesis